MKKIKNNLFKNNLKPKGLDDLETKNAYLFADEQDESLIHKTEVRDLESFKILLFFSRPYGFQIIGSLGLIFISSILAIYSAKLMGDLLEKGLIPKNMSNSLIYSGSILCLEIGSIFFIWYGRKMLAISSSKVILRIREKLFKKLHELPLQYYDRRPQGRIVTRITHDVEGVEEFFTSSLGNLISAMMMTFLAIGAMILSDFKLGIIMTLSIAPSIFLVFKTKDFLKNSNRLVSKFSSAINALVSEFLSGMEVIRGFGLEKWTMKKYDQSVDNYLYAQLKGNLLFAWSMPLVSFCASLPLVGLVWFGGKAVLTGVIGIGTFVSFIRYYERFFNPMMLLSREIHVVQQAFNSTERVISFLNEESEESVLVNLGQLSFSHLKGEIKFENVFMKYGEGDWILKNLSFHIRPGEKIGLVGRTGCGKSSMVSLMSRLYEFQKGEILIDGHLIRLFDRHQLRGQIGFVSQDAIIFKGTLRENLSCDNQLKESEILEAAKATGLYSALQNSSFSLEMEVLESGINLSVGQRQLISLTRVLLKNPSILILDEATANIDPYYEEIIQQAILKVMANRTCLMIAHRLDTIKLCDRILVFNQGELVEEGNLSELMSRKKYFFDLHHAESIH